ncbi:MAG: ThuA domain-containing protein [Pirellulales bacterium]|nr:ThuA domain-containing protein [Pirellulales bacterium]
MNKFLIATTCVLALAACLGGVTQAEDQWVVYEGKEGPGKGKHIVLVSGDEEYRSEEALPQLGKILAKHHGFKCTVLFAIDPKTGEINPNNRGNIPGLEALADADLMIIATRFRDLPDEQMQYIDDYLRSGKPVIGMRTATHAFNIKGNKPFAHYGNGYRGPKKEWQGGFGRLVLGEKWISHHGGHKTESTRGIVAPDAKDHPIARGIKDGDIWGPTDVYGVRLPLPGDSKHIILGQVMKRKGPGEKGDPFFGMKPDDDEAAPGKKNDPMMPVAWTKSYKIPKGKEGKVFTTTMGSSTDLVADGTRRMIVNGAYWCLGLDIPADGTNVDIVGEFKPTAYSFNAFKKGVKPAKHKL